jgi:hypothetical protein
MTTPSSQTPIVASSMPAGDTTAFTECDLSLPNGKRFTELDDRITYRSGPSTSDPSRYYRRSSELHNNDAEAKLLDRLANFFWNQVAENAQTRDNYERLAGAVRGTVTMVTSKGPCQSCRDVIDLFMIEFPNVRVIVRWRQELSMPSQVTAMGGDTYGYPGLAASDGFYTKILPSKAGYWDADDEDGKENKKK